MKRPVQRLLLIGSLLAGAVAVAPASAAPSHSAVGPSPVYVQWLRVDPQQPRTLYVGGAMRCADSGVSSGCADWAWRSTDGGATWTDLSEALGAAWFGCVSTVTPFVLTASSLLMQADSTCGSPSSSISTLSKSTTGGLTWASVDPPPAFGDSGSEAGYRALAVSPVSPRRIYATYYPGGGADSEAVVFSDNGGKRFDGVLKGQPAAAGKLGVGDIGGPIGSLVADPLQLNTLYANVIGDVDGRDPRTVARSEDAGSTWTMLATPSDTPALKTFAVSVSPDHSGRLVASTTDKGIPSDRRYLSSDGGRSWTRSACPGDLHGVCPAVTLADVFGAGYGWAFSRQGIYRFQATGPALDRLPISDHLPFSDAPIAAGGGARPGDPIYLLGPGMNGPTQGVLYRSTDAGKSWQQLPAGVLPTVAPPSAAPGTLFVATTKHSVAAPFVGAYRKLGPFLVGLPITEAFMEGTVLTQVFQHMQLELQHGKVTIAPIGFTVLNYHIQTSEDTALDPYRGGSGNAATPAMPADLRRFWQQQGGKAVFGAPITRVIKDQNGDGSGRVYEMQYCDNVRLERHPETHSQKYAILLGLLGNESLEARGWLTSH